MRDEIVFWFNIPPKVEKGAFNYVSSHWGEDVFYVISNDLAEYRKANGWDDNDFGEAHVIKLWESPDKDSYIRHICCCHKNAIHVLNGFTNEIQLKVRDILFNYNCKICGYTERPNYNGRTLEKIIRLVFFQFRYRRLASIYRSHIGCVLPLGELGVKAFAKYGWEKDRLFRFMYNPNIPSSYFPKYHCGKSVRFLYVGRFYYKTKGVNILMKACDRLKGAWSIDFVGGYGKNKEEVLKWIESCPNANFIGNWESKDVVFNINSYDVVVIPSNFDGWNLLVNEAIHASVGVIVSDEAVSDEVINKSCSGSVFPAGNSRLLAKQMQDVINDPEIINIWKDRAFAFINNISAPTVGEYFEQVLDYTFYNRQEKPQCPWV